ncbi:MULTISPECIES: ArsR/SmtB family transcription factor [Brevibacterium]|uniref:DNA-binding transcriptional regulator, ArsR family n=2 Tax=Brevibacterium TaxID=1696 RepID=A0A1H1V4J2_BRESA|nr:metalloregulator ArsR/SmtB family transcription factor [Brevibacterium sandarakinum]SDS79658.1 DNA-binding transcriptional regulator, ArsR family [Brevibacterium sandarakinum]
MYADNKSCTLTPDSEFVDLAVEVFSLLADATRVKIILALRDDELSVNHLADIVDKSPTSVSQHLARLRMSRMVTTRHEGTKVFYRLTDEHARRLVVDAIEQAEHTVGRTHHHAADSAERP